MHVPGFLDLIRREFRLEFIDVLARHEYGGLSSVLRVRGEIIGVANRYKQIRNAFQILGTLQIIAEVSDGAANLR